MAATVKRIIAVDLGGTNLKVALLDLRYRILYKQVLSTKGSTSTGGRKSGVTKKDSLITAIVDAVRQVIEAHRLKRRQIVGVGLGVPGPVHTLKGLVHFLPNIPGWREVYLGRILRKKLGVPVFLDNDAKLMTLAEYRLGAARGLKNAVCLTLGTGVGGGIIIEGRLYRGIDNASAEIGHIPINEHGPRCNCGGVACLEAYVSNKRLEREAGLIFGRHVSLEELSLLAKKGDKRAKALWSGAGERLGVALAGIVNLLNPEGIIIGGGIAGAGSVLFENIRKTVAKRAMRVQSRSVRILRARLGSEAGLIGAAIVAREGTGQ